MQSSTITQDKEIVLGRCFVCGWQHQFLIQVWYNDLEWCYDGKAVYRLMCSKCLVRRLPIAESLDIILTGRCEGSDA